MRVFVCYPSEHEAEARQIRNFIRSVGLDSWFDKDNLVAGDDWDRERCIALASVDLVVILCADATMGRNGVYHREINEALAHAKDRRSGTRYIIPVRQADVELPPELKRLQYVDLHATNWERSLAIALRKAVEENGKTIPSALAVAAAEPDEGGVVAHKIVEARSNGHLHAEWITYDLSGDYWEYVNSVIRSQVLGELYQSRRHLDEWPKVDEFPEGSSWEVTLSEYYRKDQLVSLTVGWFNYFVGSAHPNHGIKTINVFGEQAGIITVSELFDYDKDSLNFLGKYVDQEIVRQAISDKEIWSIERFVEELGWELFEQFSFNDQGMILNLSSGSGLPHAFGYLDVYVPWRRLEGHLSPVAKDILLAHAGN